MADASPSKNKKPRPLSVWELSKLLQSVHTYRKSKIDLPKERMHFPAILAFVYRNRFAIASQIQRRFSQQLPSDRTARRHLAEMESLGYLDVAPTNNTSPLWPKVYFVTQKGLKRLSRAYAESGKNWKPYISDRKRSEGIAAQHILHELFVTEFLLMVWEMSRDSDELEILKIERRSLVKHPSFQFGFAGKMTNLEPDGMILLRRNGKRTLYFIEADMGNMSSKQLREKSHRYRVWEQSTLGGFFIDSVTARRGKLNRPDDFYRILFLHTTSREQVEESWEVMNHRRLQSTRGNVTFLSVSEMQSFTSRDLAKWF